MPLVSTFQKNHTTFYYWQIEESIDVLREMLHAENTSLSNTTIKSNSRQKEKLVECLILKGINPNWQLGHHSNGAPYIITSNKDKVPYLSISHTHNHLILATNPKFPIGIDIEKYSDRPQAIAHRYCTTEEIAQTATISPQERSLYYLILWCMKEAFFKVLQKGQVNNMQLFHVQGFEIKTEGSTTALYTSPGMPPLGISMHYFLLSHFVLTYCEGLL